MLRETGLPWSTSLPRGLQGPCVQLDRPGLHVPRSCSDFAVRVLEEHSWAESVEQIRGQLSRCDSSYDLVTDMAGRTTLVYPDGLLFREEELSFIFLGASDREWMA